MKAKPIILSLAVFTLASSLALGIDSPRSRQSRSQTPGNSQAEPLRVRDRTSDGTCDGTRQGKVNKNGAARRGKALGPQDGSGQGRKGSGGRQGGRGRN